MRGCTAPLGTYVTYDVGHLADRVGRTMVCLVSLVISGSISLIIGDLADSGWELALALIWGLTVVSDSAQYSTMGTSRNACTMSSGRVREVRARGRARARARGCV